MIFLLFFNFVQSERCWLSDQFERQCERFEKGSVANFCNKRYKLYHIPLPFKKIVKNQEGAYDLVYIINFINYKFINYKFILYKLYIS